MRLPSNAVVLPAFLDPHLHLVRMASDLLSVDCSPQVAPTIEHLLRRLTLSAREGDSTEWLRGSGFDDALIVEGRFPTLIELDSAVSGRPLILRHRAGYEAMVNSAAAKVIADSRDPEVAALVERNASGHFTGRISGAPGRASLGLPSPPRRQIESAVQRISHDLFRHGVVAITDAGRRNDVERLAWIAEMVAKGLIGQDVTVMLAPEAVEEAHHLGVRWSSSWGGVRVGHAKVIVGEGRLDEAVSEIAAAARFGWPVAMHVTSVGELDVALMALRRAGLSGLPNRLEHVSMALPEQVEAIARSGCSVVTQPLFLDDRFRKYQREFESVELPWLHRINSFVQAGVRVAFSSDGPVSRSEPLAWIRAATRLSGPRASLGERIDVPTAIRAATRCLQKAAHEAVVPKDIVVLSDDPGKLPADDTEEITVLATLQGGRRRFVHPRMGDAADEEES